MHELNNSLCYAYVYFKAVSAPLESIYYLGPMRGILKKTR